MNRIVKNLIGWIVYLALLAGLIYGIPRGLSYYLKTDYPMASITSSSMWPALKKGDLILINGVSDKSEIEIDDIIVYKNPRGFTIHRVIKMDENTLITKGDANNVQDAPIEYSEIIGKAVNFRGKPFKVPFLGMVSVYLNKEKM